VPPRKRTPPPRRTRRGRRPRLNEAARLTQELIDAGYTKKQVADIIGRDSSLVSQFFTKNKGASFVNALRNVVQEVQSGGVSDIDGLKQIAAASITPRTRKARPGEKAPRRARTRTKDVVETPGHSSMARAAKQHIAAGASRLRPVIERTAAIDGNIAFTVRTKKSMFIHDAGRLADSPGLRRYVVRRRDGTEERAYGKSLGGAQGPGGFDAREWQQRVEAANGDVAAAVKNWMVETGRLRPEAVLTHLEIRGWKLTN
jgi:predicted transcriptional regulator